VGCSGREVAPAVALSAPASAAPIDTALQQALAMTDRFQKLCASDSAMARRVAAARVVADSARDSTAGMGDSALARDPVPMTADDPPARPASSARGSAPKAAAPSHWDGPVARRALSQAPLPGSLLPGCRVVAYYGNPFSKRMGILGEIHPDSMLERLQAQADAYARADSAVPVIPALELVTIVAQASAGRDGMYRARMPDSLIAKVASWAERRGYLLILDVQVGHSTVAKELASLLPYLRMPNVHLGLDPEFAMKQGKLPGRVIGTMDAHDINIAIDTLASLVSTHQLPPKMLIVHRFTRPMVTNHEKIRLDPRVQVVMDMDGFGAPWLKRNSYRAYVHDMPVQFAGFKLFYKNDKPLLSPEEVLKLAPVPLFIMYQ
jgi:hypothetical protein